MLIGNSLTGFTDSACLSVRVWCEGCSRGDHAIEMYFLLRGSVRLSRDPPRDAPAIVEGSEDGAKEAGAHDGVGVGGMVEAGDIFGELALFPGVRECCWRASPSQRLERRSYSEELCSMTL